MYILKRSYKFLAAGLLVLLAVGLFWYFRDVSLASFNKQGTLQSPLPSPSSVRVKNKEGIDDFEIRTERPPSVSSPYGAYLSGKKKLGFSPNEDFCLEVMRKIQKEYVDEVPQIKLLKGAKDEVRRLLIDAGYDGKGLSSIALDKNFFKNVAALYSSKVDKKLIFYACILGMVKALDDPYCSFFTPQEFEKFMESTRDTEYCGIGVRIAKEDEVKFIRILEVFKGGPAFEAGIKKDDKIIKVNGEDVSSFSIQDAANKIMGKEGTFVSLTIKRGDKILNFRLPRRKIVVSSVHFKMLKNHIGYIKIDAFKEELNSEFTKAYETLEDRGMKYLILDLRNNPGGLVRSAQSLCGKFLPRNSVIAIFRHRHGKERKVRAKGSRIVFIPVVLLVNRYSASSSEITAGALKDYDVAVVVGTRTRGKGSVQRTTPLRDGAGLKLTIEKIFTPKGFSINKYGIYPDVKVNLGLFEEADESEDITLKKAMEYIEKKYIEEHSSTSFMRLTFQIAS